MSTRKIPNRKVLTRPLPPRVEDVNDLLARIKSHGEKICYKYYEDGKLKEMTYTEVYSMVRQVAAAFNKLDLVGKRVAVIGDTSPQWLCTYMGALTAGTIKHTYHVLRGAMDKAVQAGLIHRSPCAGIQLPKGEKKKPVIYDETQV